MLMVSRKISNDCHLYDGDDNSCIDDDDDNNNNNNNNNSSSSNNNTVIEKDHLRDRSPEKDCC